MSKYNVGDKFIIEISKNDTNELDITEYYITNGSRVYEKEELDRLQKYEEVQIPYSEVYNKGLEDGRNEVWELANKLFGYTSDTKISNEDLKKIFGSACEMDILRNFTPQEALEKLEAYEKEQNIKVGDVVKNGNDETEFVVIATSEETINGQPILRPIGKTLIKGVIFASNTDLKKTGKHIDIQSLLEQIKE